MLLGFILPFALAFIAIPLESLIHSTRTVGGVLIAALVASTGFVLRVLANVARRMARVLITLYDVVIVLPLAVEHLVKVKTGLRIRPAASKRRGLAADLDDSAHETR
jgi:hypothetical protein